MDNLQKALELLAERFGEFDNIKLLLGGGGNMTRDIVGNELLAIAEGLSAESATRSGMVSETKFCEQSMAF